MTWRTPEPWAAVLVALGTYRILRLAATDEITAPLRAAVIMPDAVYEQWVSAVNASEHLGHDPYTYTQRDAGRIHIDWEDVYPDHPLPPLVAERLDYASQHHRRDAPLLPFTRRRLYVSKLLHCPWCMGWWLSLAAFAAYEAWPRGTVVALLPFALSLAVGLLGSRVDA